MEIIDRFWDPANKYKVIVNVDSETAMILKFQEEVDDEVCLDEAKRLLDLKIEQQNNNINSI
jgi:hypothetical protein